MFDEINRILKSFQGNDNAIQSLPENLLDSDNFSLIIPTNATSNKFNLQLTMGLNNYFYLNKFSNESANIDQLNKIIIGFSNYYFLVKYNNEKNKNVISMAKYLAEKDMLKGWVEVNSTIEGDFCKVKLIKEYDKENPKRFNLNIKNISSFEHHNFSILNEKSIVKEIKFINDKNNECTLDDLYKIICSKNGNKEIIISQYNLINKQINKNDFSWVNVGLYNYFTGFESTFYFPTLFRNNDSTVEYGTMAISFKKRPTEEQLSIFEVFSNIFMSRLLSREYEDVIKIVKKASIKSAIAAIMSRNMSHNLGSHFISNTKNYFNDKAKDFDLKDKDTAKDLRGIKHVMQYIQERMDFIATIVSGDTYPFGLVNFKAQIYDELNIDAKAKRHNENKAISNFLLKYIVSSEHITKNELSEDELQLKLIARFLNPMTNKYSEFDGDNQNVSLNKEEKVDFSKINIALPGGALGRHAFFIIVENIIRNSSKHGKEALKKLKENNTSLEFSILKKKEGFYIYDNKGDALSKNVDDKYLIEMISEKIKNVKILKESEMVLDKNDKGIKEIIISALWLNNLNIGDYFSTPDKVQKKEDYVNAVAVLDENNIYTYDFATEEFKKNNMKVHIDKNKSYNLGYFIKVDDFNSMHYIDVIERVNKIEYENLKDIKAEIICVNKDLSIINTNRNHTKNNDSNLNISKVYPRFYLTENKPNDTELIEIYKNIIEKNLNVKLDETKLFISKNNFSLESEDIQGNTIPIETSNDSFINDAYKGSVSIVFKDHFSNNLKDLADHTNSAFLESISGENFTTSIIQKDFLIDEMNRLRIVESSLTPIAIIDERIYRKFKGDKKVLAIGEEIAYLEGLYDKSVDSFKNHMNKNHNPIYMRRAKDKPIYNADFISNKSKLFDQIKEDFNRFYSDVSEIENIKEYLEKRKIYIFNVEIINRKAYLVDLLGEQYEIGNEKDNVFKKNDNNTQTRLYPLFASIHLSLIEKIIKDTDNDQIKEVMEQLIYKIFGAEENYFLTIHSGRGNFSEELDSALKDYSFMSLSAIESCLDNSKYMLSQLFYNTNYYGKGNINK